MSENHSSSVARAERWSSCGRLASKSGSSIPLRRVIIESGWRTLSLDQHSFVWSEKCIPWLEADKVEVCRVTFILSFCSLDVLVRFWCREYRHRLRCLLEALGQDKHCCRKSIVPNVVCKGAHQMDKQRLAGLSQLEQPDRFEVMQDLVEDVRRKLQDYGDFCCVMRTRRRLDTRSAVRRPMAQQKLRIEQRLR